MKKIWRNSLIAVLVLALALIGCFLWLTADGFTEPTHEGQPLSAWIERTRTGDMLAQDHARQVVTQIGLPAVPEMIVQIERTTSLRERVGERLRKYLPSSTWRFLPDVKKLRARRIQAMHVLQMIGPPASNAIPAVAQAFRENDVAMFSTARSTLVRLGPASVPALITLLEDNSLQQRSEAAYGLMELGPAAEPAIPALSKAIKEGNLNTARDSLYALGHIGAPAIPALTEALHDPRAEIRKIAEEELMRLSKQLPEAKVALENHRTSTIK